MLIGAAIDLSAAANPGNTYRLDDTLELPRLADIWTGGRLRP
jgi:hypothetical protein